MSVLELSGVRKDYGRVVAVKGLDLSVAPGTFVGLIGHNGAGKSTTLKMIMGLLTPSAGTVRIDGIDVHASPREARSRLGAVPEEPALYEFLTAREFLSFVREVRGVGDVDEALELTGLGADADRLIREYSQGMRRKTALAAAVLAKPKLLVLDEALNGLDPPSAARVKDKLRALCDEGCAVVLSTHVLETVERVADRVVMLAKGELIADLSTDGLAPGELEKRFLSQL